MFCSQKISVVIYTMQSQNVRLVHPELVFPIIERGLNVIHTHGVADSVLLRSRSMRRIRKKYELESLME
jgi:hypothetical protein